MIQRLKDAILELRIRLARYRLIEAMEIGKTLRHAEEMKRLIALRSDAQIERMEKRMGIR